MSNNNITITISNQPLMDKITQLQQEISTLEETITSLNAQIADLNQQVEQKQATIDSLNLQISQLQEQVSQLDAQVTALTLENSQLTQQVGQLQASVQSLNEQITGMINQINTINGETVENPVEYLAQTKSDILTALQSKGSSATSSTPFRNYANEIINIPSYPPEETTLLLHLDVDHGLNDSSSYHRPILTCGTGTPTIVTTESKFGNGSLYLDGTCGLYINQTNFYPFQTPEWTFECFFKPISWNTSTQYAFFGNRYIYHSGTSYEYDCSHRFMYYSQYEVFSFLHENISSTSTPLTKSYEFRASMPSEQWHHLAVVRNSLDPNYSEQYYLDGVALPVNTSAAPSMYNNQRDISIFHNMPAVMGLMCYNAQTEFNRFIPCYVNEIRFSSVCRYTTNFTPSTEPFSV